MRPISEYREALESIQCGSKAQRHVAALAAALDELERVREENGRLRADLVKGRELAGNMIAEWRRFRAKHFPEIPDTEVKP